MATTTKWCHDNIPMIRLLIEILVQKSKCADVRNMQKMVGRSRLPGSHVSVAWQKRGIASDHSITVQTRASHTTHAFVHGSSSWGYTFEACIFGAVRVRYDVGEVDVLKTVVAEVVVHVRFFFGEVLDESNIFGATVVVHGRRGTCRSGLGEDVLGESA